MVTSGVGDAQSMLEFIAEHTSDVFVRADRQAVITYVSPSVRLFGYQPEELVGTRGTDLIHPDDLPRLAENTAALLRGEVRRRGPPVPLASERRDLAVDRGQPPGRARSGWRAVRTGDGVP